MWARFWTRYCGAPPTAVLCCNHNQQQQNSKQVSKQNQKVRCDWWMKHMDCMHAKLFIWLLRRDAQFVRVVGLWRDCKYRQSDRYFWRNCLIISSTSMEKSLSLETISSSNHEGSSLEGSSLGDNPTKSCATEGCKRKHSDQCFYGMCFTCCYELGGYK